MNGVGWSHRAKVRFIFIIAFCVWSLFCSLVGMKLQKHIDNKDDIILIAQLKETKDRLVAVKELINELNLVIEKGKTK